MSVVRAFFIILDFPKTFAFFEFIAFNEREKAQVLQHPVVFLL